MNILERCDLIKKNNIPSKYSPGFVGKVFEYHEKCEKNLDGTLPVIIKLEPEEKKKKKSIN